MVLYCTSLGVFELYNEANILLKKELEELERELEMLKNCELSESTMQESFSTLLEQINLIKQRFIKGYAVIIMDKLFNNMNKSIVKDSFRKIFNNNDPHLKEIFLLKIFKKTNDGLRVHFKKLWSLLSTKKVEETLSLRKFYVKTNEINKMMISHETLKD